MSSGPPILHGDPMSQPFRACVVFCRTAGIQVQIKQVQIGKGENRSPEYLKINPLGKVPALQDGSFSLFESPSIMRYLAETQPGVADHWYPRDPQRRARINSAMDWHLNNLRIGSATTVWNRAIVKNLNLPGNERLVQDYGLPMLRNSLKTLNDVWLAGGANFVAGGAQPSVADLLMACEIEMLCLLDAADEGPTLDDLLNEYPRIRPWLQRVASACSPHYEQAHAVLRKVRQRMVARKQQQAASRL